MKDDIQIVKRHEHKYYINYAEYYYLKQLLQTIMEPDLYAKENGEYYIRSLYFDSVDNTDYYTKLAGIENRKKVRLRIYDLDTDKVKLEVKNRFNTSMSKESLTISREEAVKMIGTDASFLDKYSEKPAIRVKNYMINHLYSPKVIVDYEREAFVDNGLGVRVTFDKNIRCAYSDNMFDKTLGLIPVFRDPVMILEIKFNRVLPDHISNVICTGRALNSSISKYCMARGLVG